MTAGAAALVAKGLRDFRVRAYPLDDAARLDATGPYPLDVRVISEGFRLDGDGIVVIAGPDGHDYHNPVSIGLYGLGHHTQACRSTADSGSLASFLTQARHLRRSQDAEGGWLYPVSAARYRVSPGWYSAMAQGLAASVLLRAYDRTGEQSYVDAAEGAVRLLLRPLQDGGCAHYDDLGRPFLEECPSDPPCHILNGAMFAMVGLREWEARTDGRTHVAVVQRLTAELSRFDIGYWSRYDLRFAAPATMAYHSLHISLLEMAARLFADQAFRSTAGRWHSYLRRPTYRLRAATVKALFVVGQRRG